MTADELVRIYRSGGGSRDPVEGIRAVRRIISRKIWHVHDGVDSFQVFDEFDGLWREFAGAVKKVKRDGFMVFMRRQFPGQFQEWMNYRRRMGKPVLKSA